MAKMGDSAGEWEWERETESRLRRRLGVVARRSALRGRRGRRGLVGVDGCWLRDSASNIQVVVVLAGMPLLVDSCLLFPARMIVVDVDVKGVNLSPCARKRAR